MRRAEIGPTARTGGLRKLPMGFPVLESQHMTVPSGLVPQAYDPGPHGDAGATVPLGPPPGQTHVALKSSPIRV